MPCALVDALVGSLVSSLVDFCLIPGWVSGLLSGLLCLLLVFCTLPVEGLAESIRNKTELWPFFDGFSLVIFMKIEKKIHPKVIENHGFGVSWGLQKPGILRHLVSKRRSWGGLGGVYFGAFCRHPPPRSKTRKSSQKVIRWPPLAHPRWTQNSL